MEGRSYTFSFSFFLLSLTEQRVVQVSSAPRRANVGEDVEVGRGRVSGYRVET